MAIFKPFKCLESQLSSLPVVDGQIIFTTDTKRIYADISTNRVLYSSDGDKANISDIVKTFDIEQMYEDNQVYSASAIHELAQLFDEGISTLDKDLTKYVDDEIAKLPGQDELDAFGKAIADSVAKKADKTTVDELTTTVNNKTDKSYVDGLVAASMTSCHGYTDEAIAAIEIPVYTIKESTTTEGYAKSYALTKDGVETGVKINVPKDLVVNSGSVKEVTTVGVPYATAAIGDKYIDLVLNDSAEDHIYIPVKDLVDVYTGVDGDKIKITINSDNSIEATIKTGTIAKTDLTNDLQTEINNKQETLVSGTNIKTINGEAILGEGDIEIVGTDNIFYWDGRGNIQGGVNALPEQIDLWQEIVNKSLEETVTVILEKADDSNYPSVLFTIPKGKILSSTTSITLRGAVQKVSSIVREDIGAKITGYQSTVTIKLDNLTVTNVGGVSGTGSASHGFLPTDNTGVTSYTPTYDYHPATKKYVDDNKGTVITLNRWEADA